MYNAAASCVLREARCSDLPHHCYLTLCIFVIPETPLCFAGMFGLVSELHLLNSLHAQRSSTIQEYVLNAC